MQYKKFIWLFVAFIGLSCDRLETDMGLNRAAFDGDIQKVIRLLSAEATSTERVRMAKHRFTMPAFAGHREIVELLIANNTKVNPIC